MHHDDPVQYKDYHVAGIRIVTPADEQEDFSLEMYVDALDIRHTGVLKRSDPEPLAAQTLEGG